MDQNEITALLRVLISYQDYGHEPQACTNFGAELHRTVKVTVQLKVITN